VASFEIRFRAQSNIWQGVPVLELGQGAFFAKTPSEVMVVGDKNHMVRIYNSERRQAVTHYGKQCHEQVVDYVNDVVFLTANIDPAWYLISDTNSI
jgi:hypothetical protein